MLMQFNGNGTPQGVAISVQTDPNWRGTVVCQGFAPFWIGNSKQALEQLSPPPPGGFNVEVRDGFYVNQNLQGPAAGPSYAPVVIPWVGQVWILNGKGPLDQINNVVEVQCFGC